jgi:hypothetical protein
MLADRLRVEGEESLSQKAEADLDAIWEYMADEIGWLEKAIKGRRRWELNGIASVTNIWY